MQKKIHVTFFLIFVTFMVIETFRLNTVYAALEDGLELALTFDEGDPNFALDFSGNGNDGIIIGGVKSTNSGKLGLAMEFNGVDGYIEVDSSASLEQEQAFTVSAWVKLEQAGDFGIVWKGEMLSGGPNYMFRIGATGNNLIWGVSWEETEGGFATDNVITPGEWNFVALAVDGKQAAAYVIGQKGVVIPSSSGVQSNTVPVQTPFLTFPDYPLEIGRGVGIDGNPNNIRYLEGLIDEVYLWSRALNAAELQRASEGLLQVTAVESAGKLTITWGEVRSGKHR